MNPTCPFTIFASEQLHGSCEACSMPLHRRKAYRVPKLAGMFCSIACIETALFGGEHCRWCAERIDRPYTGIESRLCSEDCRANYYAHVLGDYTAELGTGKRLLVWLQRKQPELYRRIIRGERAESGYCQNPRCPNGESGLTASLTHLRAGTLFCSDACRVQANRSPNHDFSHPKRAVFVEVSRNTSGGEASTVNPANFRVSRNTSGRGAQH